MRRPLGQAAVELAIGLVVFTTVLILGIHLAEVGSLSLRVQAQAVSILWDATSAPMHQFQTAPYFGPLQVLLQNGPTPNGLGQLTERTETFTRLQNPKLLCGPSGAIRFDTASPTASSNAAGAVYQDLGALACSAQAELSAWKIPARLAGAQPLLICGMGRAVGGTCASRFSLLLDDWGLAGPEQSASCDLYACANTQYWNAAKTAFDVSLSSVPNNLKSAASLFATHELLMAASPVNESQFWLSFVGAENNFSQTLRGPTLGEATWPTSPGGSDGPYPEYAASAGARQPLFLGEPETFHGFRPESSGTPP